MEEDRSVPQDLPLWEQKFVLFGMHLQVRRTVNPRGEMVTAVHLTYGEKKYSTMLSFFHSRERLPHLEHLKPEGPGPMGSPALVAEADQLARSIPDVIGAARAFEFAWHEVQHGDLSDPETMGIVTRHLIATVAVMGENLDRTSNIVLNEEPNDDPDF